jgi:hypothetical protein
MRTYKSTSGPFQERPFYKPEEVERICSEELRAVDLYPAKPEPIRIERFIEKRFSVTPVYEELPEGVLGWTRFGAKGVDQVIVARSIGESDGLVAERRVSSTMAHEAGHGLLHSHLFVLGAECLSLFPKGQDVEAKRILCRDADGQPASGRRGYDGRWWEYQANMAMVALLLPQRLVEDCIEPFLRVGSLGKGTLEPKHRAEATYRVSDVFAVNPIMARLRLAAMYPDSGAAQLTL